MGSADLAHHCANAVAQQSFEASWVRLAYAVFSRLPLHREAGAAAGSQNVAEAAQAEATVCVCETVSIGSDRCSCCVLMGDVVSIAMLPFIANPV